MTGTGRKLPRPVRTAILASALAAVLWLPGPGHGETALPERITDEVLLSGEHRADGMVTVESGGSLILSEGSRILFGEGAGIDVHGTLRVEGSAEGPVVLGADGASRWRGIFFHQGSSGEIKGLELKAAETGLSVLASRLRISDSEITACVKGLYLVREADVQADGIRVADNQVGVVAEMKSTARIRGCVFEGNRTAVGIASGARPVISGSRFTRNEMGIQVSQRYPEAVRGNLFEGNRIAVRLYQNGPDTVVEGNLFTGNEETAILVVSFSSPKIRNNMVREGRYGLFANQFSSPVIDHNVFEGLQEAIHLDKKNASPVTGNIIARSQTGLFLDFSSYPAIRENVFSGNGTHIRLGKFQSSHWEASAGSRKYVMQTAARLGSRNPKLAEGGEDFPEAVDASGNHWDDTTAEEIRRVGPDANISSLYDGHDLPEVTYEGFGEQKYRLDRIVYSPILESPPAGAGLTGWKGGRDELQVP